MAPVKLRISGTEDDCRDMLNALLADYPEAWDVVKRQNRHDTGIRIYLTVFPVKDGEPEPAARRAADV